MTHPNPSTALAAVVIDQLAAGGVETIAISPGSRSAALAIAAVSHPEIRDVVIIDERSAAFFALGVARATGRPAAVLSTSGTAPANHFPAVVEADMSCVPLVVISADRPAELRGVGANQTIDQVELFGGKVRRFEGIEAPGSSEDMNEGWRTTVQGLMAAAIGTPPGPVHLNVAFREPTVPVSDDGRSRASVYPFEIPRLRTQPAGAPSRSEDLPELDATKGLLIAGDGEYDRQALIEHATAIGWPILATAVSGLRGQEVVTSYHHLLARDVPERLRPRTVVAVGAIGPSDSLERLIADADERVRVDRWGRHLDPRRNSTAILRGDPVDLIERVVGSADPDWRAGWVAADRERRRSLHSAVFGGGGMTGGRVARALNQVDWEGLVVASSLPIREIDGHLERHGPVVANRGASGIDGFVSTALGVASAWPRTLAFAGDLSLLHDGNGFLLDARIDLTLVVIDNQGGGLFDSLPQAVHAPEYERLFVTPPKRDLETFARWHGLGYVVADDATTLIVEANRALADGGMNLIVVPVDRQIDARARAQLLS